MFENLHNGTQGSSACENWKHSWKNPGSKEDPRLADVPKVAVLGILRALSYLTIVVPVAEAFAFRTCHTIAVEKQKDETKIDRLNDQKKYIKVIQVGDTFCMCTDSQVANTMKYDKSLNLGVIQARLNEDSKINKEEKKFLTYLKQGDPFILSLTENEEKIYKVTVESVYNQGLSYEKKENTEDLLKVEKEDDETGEYFKIKALDKDSDPPTSYSFKVKVEDSKKPKLLDELKGDDKFLFNYFDTKLKFKVIEKKSSEDFEYNRNKKEVKLIDNSGDKCTIEMKIRSDNQETTIVAQSEEKVETTLFQEEINNFHLSKIVEN